MVSPGVGSGVVASTVGGGVGSVFTSSVAFRPAAPPEVEGGPVLMPCRPEGVGLGPEGPPGFLVISKRLPSL
jgi:hypothetical protein